jgi:hypothetical protein
MVGRPMLRYIRSALIFTALMLFFIIWRTAVESANSVEAKSKGMLVAQTRTSSSLEVEQLAKQVALAPLNQQLVNAYYVAAVQGLTKLNLRQKNQLRDALAALGWRSTAAHQNILMHAVTENDIKTIALHADSLLRRQQLTQQIKELLYLFEASSVGRSELVERLKLSPPWRTETLTDISGFAGTERLNARAETLTAMFEADLRPTQLELAPVVNQLHENNQKVKSYALWRQFTGKDAEDSSITDRSFNYALKARESEYYTEFPYEWRTRRGLGYSSTFFGDGTDAQAVLRWNGSGAPELLDQYFRKYTGSGIIYISGPNLDLQTVRSLEFSIICNDKRAYFDTLKVINKNAFVLYSRDKGACDFPRILISGKPSNGVSSLEARLSAIELKSN